jgi:hypothetical protein
MDEDALGLGIFQQKMPLFVGVLFVGADTDIADGFCGWFGVENRDEKKWYSMRIILLHY